MVYCLLSHLRRHVNPFRKQREKRELVADKADDLRVVVQLQQNIEGYPQQDQKHSKEELLHRSRSLHKPHHEKERKKRNNNERAYRAKWHLIVPLYFRPLLSQNDKANQRY